MTHAANLTAKALLCLDDPPAGVVDAAAAHLAAAHELDDLPSPPACTTALRILTDGDASSRAAVARQVTCPDVQQVAMRDTSKAVRTALLRNRNLDPGIAAELVRRIVRASKPDVDLLAEAGPHMDDQVAIDVLTDLTTGPRRNAYSAAVDDLTHRLLVGNLNRVRLAQAAPAITVWNWTVAATLMRCRNTDPTFPIWDQVADDVQVGRLILDATPTVDADTVAWMVDHDVLAGLNNCQQVTVDAAAALAAHATGVDVHWVAEIVLPRVPVDDPSSLQAVTDLYTHLADVNASHLMHLLWNSSPLPAHVDGRAISTAAAQVIAGPVGEWPVRVAHMLDPRLTSLPGELYRTLIGHVGDYGTLPHLDIPADMPADLLEALCVAAAERGLFADAATSTDDRLRDLALELLPVDTIAKAMGPTGGRASTTMPLTARMIADVCRDHSPTVAYALALIGKLGATQPLPTILQLAVQMCPPPDPVPDSGPTERTDGPLALFTD